MKIGRLQRKCTSPSDNPPRRTARRGLSAPEVLVVLAIVLVLALFVIAGLPRQRESSRFAGCQRNLMRIGFGLVLYDQMSGHLPVVPELPASDPAHAGSPLKTLLQGLALPDLEGLSNPKKAPPGRPGIEVVERRVAGFLCGSDRNAIDTPFPAPVSYRATTGDATDGRNGAFAPGRPIDLAGIEARDGTSYTAAFAERLLGGHRTRAVGLARYQSVPGPVEPAGCPPADPGAWRDDAGASWAVAGWQSTLYNHGLPPGASPSCIAGDGRTALMGASSGHVRGINMLIFDGSVRTVTPRVDPKVWRDWARIDSPASSPETTSRE